LGLADQRLNDAILALMALGYKQQEAHDSARQTQAMLGAETSVEDIVRTCLKKG
jgi:Holliday junction resolvasome RuvABC DNA-binding subunit